MELVIRKNIIFSDDTNYLLFGLLDIHIFWLQSCNSEEFGNKQYLILTFWGTCYQFGKLDWYKFQFRLLHSWKHSLIDMNLFIPSQLEYNSSADRALKLCFDHQSIRRRILNKNLLLYKLQQQHLTWWGWDPIVNRVSNMWYFLTLYRFIGHYTKEIKNKCKQTSKSGMV